MADFSIANPFWQHNFPEYELEGLWTCGIRDINPSPEIMYGRTSVVNPKTNLNIHLKYNNISVDRYMPLGFDKYISSVSIPQLNFSYKTTEYGMVNFDEKSAYDDITLTFYDDIKGSCLAFFNDWMHFIYDEDRNCLLPNWRYEAKDILVTYYRAIYTNFTPIVSYKMRKCLPKNISDINAEEEAGTRKTFSVNLSCQKIINNINNSQFGNLNKDEIYIPFTMGYDL